MGGNKKKKKPSVIAHSSLHGMPLEKREHDSLKESSQALLGLPSGVFMPVRYLWVGWKGRTGLPPPKAECSSWRPSTVRRSGPAVAGEPRPGDTALPRGRSGQRPLSLFLPQVSACTL